MHEFQSIVGRGRARGVGGGGAAPLDTRVDPAADDWRSEALAAEAEGRLRELARWLGSPAGEPPAQLLAADARATRLAPEGLARRTLHGGIEIARGAPDSRTERAASALHDLVGRFAGARSRRVEIAIVGVDVESAALRTRARVETAAVLADGRLAQQTAEWTVEWTVNAGPPGLQIAAIRLESFEEASRQAPLLRDATAAVLGAELAGSERLARGGEHWYGRIDGLGEPNFLGSNGIAIGDVDGDGREDLYVAMGTGLPNLLLVQQPDGSVRDVAAQAGVAWLDDTKGVLLADTDGDGDRDLLLAMGPMIVLAKNDGRGRFERFLGMRAPTPGAFHSLSAADYDVDGDLDVFGTRLVEPALGEDVPLPLYDATNGRTSHLMRNDGNDRFTDVTREVGLDAGHARFATIGVWGDPDGDGEPDLVVVNAFGRSALYRNDGGRFTDVAREVGAGEPGAGMGASFGDYDLDGDLDLFLTRVYSAAGARITAQPRFSAADRAAREALQPQALGNTLLANRGDGTFEDVSDAAAVRMGRWGRGGRFADLNNDGREDLVVPNGFVSGTDTRDLASFYWRRVAAAGPEAYAEGWAAMARLIRAGHSWAGGERNSCFLNAGEGRFADLAFVGGIDFTDDARAVVATDWDGDGDLDLWLRNRSGPQLRFLRNDLAPRGHFVCVELVGTQANRDAVGARVEVEAGGRKLVRAVSLGDGYLAQSSTRLHFGLGDASRIDRIRVRWPAGAVETLDGPPLDRHYRLAQGTGHLEEIPARTVRVPDRPPVPPATGPSRVLLKGPLARPPSLTGTPGEGRSGRAKLLALGPHDRGASDDALREAGVDVLVLDPLEDGTRKTLDAILRHVLLRHEKLSPATSLLVDGEARLQIVYVGPVDAARVVEDARTWALGKAVPGASRSLHGGRWYFSTERALTRLAGELRDLGREEDARFYYLLDQGWRHQLRAD
jgi:hypothetical protein